MARDLTRLFAEIVAVEGELRAALDARLQRECGLPLNRFELLRAVAERDGCQVRDIAGELSLTTGGTSKLLDRVEQAGLCERQPNPADRRSSIVELTETGRRAVTHGSAVVKSELELRLGLLDKRSLVHLSAVLGRLAAAETSAR
jgi:DNA-binding MarR family transcriptional regulator